MTIKNLENYSHIFLSCGQRLNVLKYTKDHGRLCREKGTTGKMGACREQGFSFSLTGNEGDKSGSWSFSAKGLTLWHFKVFRSCRVHSTFVNRSFSNGKLFWSESCASNAQFSWTRTKFNGGMFFDNLLHFTYQNDSSN